MSPTTIPGNLILRNTYVAPPLLVYYPGAAAAYSLRNLTENNISVVRVRRDNDDAEQDFTATEVSDGTLAAWVGAGNNGFVRTWYDQSGNIKNATQSIVGNQPKVVDANQGLIKENGKAALNFTGSQFFNTSVSLNNALISVFAVNTYNNVLRNSGFLGAQNSAQDFTYMIVNPGFVYFGNGSGSNYFAIDQRGLLSLETPVLTTAIAISSQNRQIFTNGNPSSVNTVNYSTGFTLRISSRDQPLNKPAQELIVYSSNQSTNRTGIEANINAYYSIYP